MEEHQSTFFTHIRQVSQQTPDSPPSPPKEPIQQSKKVPAWLMPVAIGFLMVQVIALVGWYSHQLRTQTKSSLNSTLAKLVTIEKYGYDMRGYHARVQEQDSRLRSFGSLLFPPLVQQVKAEVTQMDKQLNSQYSQILLKEKAELRSKIASAEAQMMLSRLYDYPSKNDVIKGVERLKSSIDAEDAEVQQLDAYEEELVRYQTIMKKELNEVLHDQLGALERDYSFSVNYNYPSRASIEGFIEKQGTATHADIPELDVTLDLLKKTTVYTLAIKNEVEEQKRLLIFNTITNTTKEVDDLLAFFSQRSGYTNEISQLNQYKNTVARFIPSNYTNVTSNELQRQAETELYALVVTPRQTKHVAEEKERQELIARQKKLEEENGIPVPPLDTSKLVLVDIGKQRLYAYENGVSIFNEPVPVTTGKNGYDTVKGTFSIYLKTTHFRMRSPFPNEWYDNYVDYWMPFYQGYGFHDASWRSVYGTMDYPSLGSHGCVNIPYSYVQQLYAWAEVGTAVVVR